MSDYERYYGILSNYLSEDEMTALIGYMGNYAHNADLAKQIYSDIDLIEKDIANLKEDINTRKSAGLSSSVSDLENKKKEAEEKLERKKGLLEKYQNKGISMSDNYSSTFDITEVSNRLESARDKLIESNKKLENAIDSLKNLLESDDLSDEEKETYNRSINTSKAKIEANLQEFKAISSDIEFIKDFEVKNLHLLGSAINDYQQKQVNNVNQNVSSVSGEPVQNQTAPVQNQGVSNNSQRQGVVNYRAPLSEGISMGNDAINFYLHNLNCFVNDRGQLNDLQFGDDKIGMDQKALLNSMELTLFGGADMSKEAKEGFAAKPIVKLSDDEKKTINDMVKAYLAEQDNSLKEIKGKELFSEVNKVRQKILDDKASENLKNIKNSLSEEQLKILNTLGNLDDKEVIINGQVISSDEKKKLANQLVNNFARLFEKDGEGKLKPIALSNNVLNSDQYKSLVDLANKLNGISDPNLQYQSILEFSDNMKYVSNMITNEKITARKQEEKNMDNASVNNKPKSGRVTKIGALASKISEKIKNKKPSLKNKRGIVGFFGKIKTSVKNFIQKHERVADAVGETANQKYDRIMHMSDEEFANWYTNNSEKFGEIVSALKIGGISLEDLQLLVNKVNAIGNSSENVIEQDNVDVVETGSKVR